MKSLVPGPMKIVKFKNGILNPSSVGFTNSVVLKENILRFLPPFISREFFDKKRGEVEVKFLFEDGWLTVYYVFWTGFYGLEK